MSLISCGSIHEGHEWSSDYSRGRQEIFICLTVLFSLRKQPPFFAPGPSGVLRHSGQACVSQKTRKLLGREDFSGLFSHPSFSGCFLGFAARACTELGSSGTLQIKPSFVDSFVESQANFWLFLSFVQFQHRLLYFD